MVIDGDDSRKAGRGGNTGVVRDYGNGLAGADGSGCVCTEHIANRIT